MGKIREMALLAIHFGQSTCIKLRTDLISEALIRQSSAVIVANKNKRL